MSDYSLTAAGLAEAGIDAQALEQSKQTWKMQMTFVEQQKIKLAQQAKELFVAWASPLFAKYPNLAGFNVVIYRDEDGDLINNAQNPAMDFHDYGTNESDEPSDAEIYDDDCWAGSDIYGSRPSEYIGHDA